MFEKAVCMKRILFALLLVLGFAGYSVADGRNDLIDEAPDPAAAVVATNSQMESDSQAVAASAAPKADSVASAPCIQQEQSEQAAQPEKEGGVPIMPIVVSVLATAAFIVLAILF